MDLMAAAAFSTEAQESDLLDHKPRDPKAKFMDKAMLSSIGSSSIGLFAAVTALYLFTWYTTQRSRHRPNRGILLLVGRARPAGFQHALRTPTAAPDRVWDEPPDADLGKCSCDLPAPGFGHSGCPPGDADHFANGRPMGNDPGSHIDRHLLDGNSQSDYLPSKEKWLMEINNKHPLIL